MRITNIKYVLFSHLLTFLRFFHGDMGFCHFAKRLSNSSFILGILLLFLTAGKVHAEITSVTVSGGYSGFSEDTTNKTLTLSGGYTGQTNCVMDGVNICNSCELSTSGLVPCNERMVYPTLKVRVNFRTTATNLTTSSKIAVKGPTTPLTYGSDFQSTTGTLTPNSDLFFELTWATLCDANVLNITAACTGESFKSAQITFGVDTNGDGTLEESRTMTINFSYVNYQSTTATINFCSDANATVAGNGVCGYSMFPGDEKAYLLTPTLSTGYPSSAGGTSGNSWDAIVLFYAPTTTPSTFFSASGGVKSSDRRKPITFSGTTDNPTFSTDFASEGITNDQQYCFALGNRDIGGNIYQFISLTDSANIQTASDSLCVTPQHISGLLDNKHCFIATAAFGSSMSREVHILRQFRDHFLNAHSWGRTFVEFYYNVSPPIAAYIAEFPILRSVVRGALWPLIYFAQLSLEMGLISGLLGLLSSLLLILVLLWFLKIKFVKKPKNLNTISYSSSNRNIFMLLVGLHLGFFGDSFLGSKWNLALAQKESTRSSGNTDNSSDTSAPPSPNPLDVQPQEPPFINLDQEFDPNGPNTITAPSGAATLPLPSTTDSGTGLIPVEKNGPDEKKKAAEISAVRKESSSISQPSDPDNPNERSYINGDSKVRVEKIQHPLSKKGLKSIEADGTYVYKVNVRKSEVSGNFRAGLISPPSISNGDANASFSKLYGSSQLPILMYDYEWKPFKSINQMKVQAGLGFFMSQGHGYFASPVPANSNKTPLEKFTFFALPLNLGVIYRIEYKRKQWVVPFLVGGGSAYILGETRDDKSSPHFLVSPTIYGGGGLLFNLTALDRNLEFTLDNEYGIVNLWLNLEFRYQQSFSNDVDMSTSLMAFGFSVDY